MAIPPIAVELARRAPRLLLRPACFVAGRLIWNDYANSWMIPLWLVIVVLAASYPFTSTIGSIYSDWTNERRAAMNNAILCPRVDGGTLALLKELQTSFRAPHTQARVLFRWAEKYGNAYRFTVLGEERIFTTEPEHLKALMAAPVKFIKGKVTNEQAAGVLGDSIFSTDGDQWKFHRNMTRPFFAKQRVADHDLFERYSEMTIALLKERLEDGHAVDFQDAVSRFTMDASSEFVFGRSVDSLGAGLAYPAKSGLQDGNERFHNHPSNAFVTAFTEACMYMVLRMRTGPYWRLFEPWKDEIAPRRKTMEEFVDPLIKEAVASKGVLGKQEKSENTLLSDLIEQCTDEAIIKDELISMLFAGRDTTSATLAWAMYMLSEHPHVVKRLKADILSIVGPDRRPTFQQISELKYLRAFVNETLRLYPSVALQARVASEDLVFPGRPGTPPVFVPANTRIQISPAHLHRRTDLWGPDALTFDPERWLDERHQKYYAANPYIFLPFSSGPRVCMGQQFAYNIISYFLVRVLQTFSEFAVDMDAQPDSSKVYNADWFQPSEPGRPALARFMSLTMSVKDGLWMNMK